MFWTVTLGGGPKRVNHAAAKVGHHIYSFGGFNKSINYEKLSPISVHDLNTATLRWKEIKVNQDEETCPFQRYGHTVVQYGSDIILWGGRNDAEACNKTFVFDTRNKEWRCPVVTGDIPIRRDGHSACVINDRMYIFGGFLDDVNVFCDEVYYLDLKTMHWTQVKIMGNIRPPGRDFHSSPVIGTRMYIIGGRGHSNSSAYNFYTNEKYRSSVYYFDTLTNTWHKPDLKGDIPAGRRSHSTFVFDGCIYMFGGCNGSSGQHFNDIDMFNPETNEWKEVKPLGTPPLVRRRQSCVVVGDQAFMFGGSCPKPTSSSDVEDVEMYFDPLCSNLVDFDDLHVLELRTLKTFCIMKVIQEDLNTESLPLQLRIEIKNMSTPNSIAS